MTNLSSSTNLLPLIILSIFSVVPLFFDYQRSTANRSARHTDPLHLNPCIVHQPRNSNSETPWTIISRILNGYRFTTSTVFISQNSGHYLRDCISSGSLTKQCNAQTLTPVIVRHITSDTKHLVPPYAEVGFEFIDLSDSYSFQNGILSINEYHEMLHKVTGRLLGKRKSQTTTVSVDQRDAMLVSIVNDFGNRHGMELEIHSIQFVRPYQENHKERHIHFHDRMTRLFKLWIPLNVIDDYVLTVGDTNDLMDRRCAGRHSDWKMHRECETQNDFAKTVWYQQPVMRPQDVIFFADDKVPHFSTNQGDDRYTKARLALMVKIRLKAGGCLNGKRLNDMNYEGNIDT